MSAICSRRSGARRPAQRPVALGGLIAGAALSHSVNPACEQNIRRVFVPGALPANPLNQRRHWRAVWKEGKEWRRRVATAALLELRGPDHDPRAPKRVTFTAFVWNLHDTEDDIAASLKPVRDALGPRHQQLRRTVRGLSPVVGVGAEIVHSDGPKSGHVFEYHQQIDRKRPGVLIEVEPLGDLNKAVS